MRNNDISENHERWLAEYARRGTKSSPLITQWFAVRKTYVDEVEGLSTCAGGKIHVREWRLSHNRTEDDCDGECCGCTEFRPTTVQDLRVADVWTEVGACLTNKPLSHSERTHIQVNVVAEACLSNIGFIYRERFQGGEGEFRQQSSVFSARYDKAWLFPDDDISPVLVYSLIDMRAVDLRRFIALYEQPRREDANEYRHYGPSDLLAMPSGIRKACGGDTTGASNV